MTSSLTLLLTSFWTREGSQNATTVVVLVDDDDVEVVVTVFEKCLKLR